MTVGSWDRSVPDNGTSKRTYTKSWNGSDQARIEYPRSPLITVQRYSKRQGKVITIQFRKKRSGVDRPPKRAKYEDHPYSMTLLNLRDLKGRYRRADGSIGGPAYYMDNFCVPSWTHGLTAANAFDANAQIKLIGKLREKLNGSDFNLGNVLGEGHQTLRMIGDTAISIAKSLHHLKKGDLAGAARSLLEPANRKPIKPYKKMAPFRPTADTISSKWLELQYGWKPLLSDVEAGAQFVAHKLSVPVSQTYRMSIKREVSSVRNSTGFWTPVTASATTVARRSLKVTVSEHPSVMQQLGLLNPEVVAWEIMPWSFVIDWFLPIGSWLEARATLSGVKISKTVQSTTIRSTAFCPKGGALLDIPYDESICQYQRVLLERTVTAGGPKLPLPGVKPLSESLSVGHCLNGIALLEQLGSGYSKKRERNRALTDSLPPSSHRNGIIPSAM
jgi:hypothetical protein